MKKKTIEQKSPKEKAAEMRPTIEHYYSFNKKPMVRIKGSFYGGGFNLSYNKLKAVIDLLPELKAFAGGEHNELIKGLEENEVLVPEETT